MLFKLVAYVFFFANGNKKQHPRSKLDCYQDWPSVDEKLRMWNETVLYEPPTSSHFEVLSLLITVTSRIPWSLNSGYRKIFEFSIKFPSRRCFRCGQRAADVVVDLQIDRKAERCYEWRCIVQQWARYFLPFDWKSLDDVWNTGRRWGICWSWKDNASCLAIEKLLALPGVLVVAQSCSCHALRQDTKLHWLRKLLKSGDVKCEEIQNLETELAG